MLQDESAILRDSVSWANLHRYNQISMAARVCSRLIAEIAGSNPAEGMDICFF
jgi:hypothetical protein